ncbi:alpha/beta hydrolase fold domain-containing protein [Luteimicrobium sp. NPDC057192]|uniref:alpha/beta hydrolase fold domain-containing protein n=1 Tax=Luteimicrobium sp. NPDC057192 TaxID=3346042 RepID=UPI0036256D62
MSQDNCRRALSCASGADVLTGAGLARSLTGVEAVVDVSNRTTLSARQARRFSETATKNLLAAEHELADLARRRLAHDGVRRRVLELRTPGAYGRGGDMAAALAPLAKHRGDVAFVHQSLYHPVTDAAQDTPSHVEFAHGPYLTAAAMAWS